MTTGTIVSSETVRSAWNTVKAQVEQRRLGKRKLVRHGGALCSGCYTEPPRPGQRYCLTCHAADSRKRAKADREELKRLRAAHGDPAE